MVILMKNLLPPAGTLMSASRAQQYLQSLSPEELKEVFAPYQCGLIRHMVWAPNHRLRLLARFFLGVSLGEVASLGIQEVAQLFVEKKMVLTFAELGNVLVRASQKLGGGYGIFAQNSFVEARSSTPGDLFLLVQNDEGIVSLARLVCGGWGKYKVTVSDIGDHDLFEAQAQIMLFRHEGKECLWNASLEDRITPDSEVTKPEALLEFFPKLQLGEPANLLQAQPLAKHPPIGVSALGKVLFDSVTSSVPKQRPGIGQFSSTNNGHDDETYTALMGESAGLADHDWFAQLVHEKGMAFSVGEFIWILQNLGTIAVALPHGSSQSRDLFVYHEGTVYYVKIFDDGKLGMTADLPRDAHCFLHLTRLLLRLPQTNATWQLKVVLPQ